MLTDSQLAGDTATMLQTFTCLSVNRAAQQQETELLTLGSAVSYITPQRTNMLCITKWEHTACCHFLWGHMTPHQGVRANLMIDAGKPAHLPGLLPT
ncbi:hypothetical protein FKM82_028497 [Ascaphus truei]